ncbi:MAG: radical SAM protein [Armatimonadetes bacterium]|nr:radical SAM protein [Armatimonadota bacterium]
MDFQPRIIAWELTKRCNLFCAHCRAWADDRQWQGELKTEECKAFIDDLKTFERPPMLILTGGEPQMRPDFYEIAAYAKDKGIRTVLATNGLGLTCPDVEKIKGLEIPRVSISIDFPTQEEHDRFRGMAGAYRLAMQGIGNLKEAGVGFQVNTTVTKMNRDKLPAIRRLVEGLGAEAWHVFLLVPTGRGEDLVEVALTPEEYEETLNWLYEVHRDSHLMIKATDAPHYYRILRQRAKADGVQLKAERHGMNSLTRGCLGGLTFYFVSATGNVQICGYLPVAASNIRREPFSYIWANSEMFLKLRDFSNLEGRCGRCEFVNVCGGCRARAYAMTGSYLGEEPFCTFQPTRQG